MREIKFRGKRLTDGKWIYGDFFRNRGLAFIAADGIVRNPLASWQDYNVDPDTVGQFTGIHDREGNEIYEGDIVLQQGYNGRKQPMAIRFECGAFIVGYHSGSSTKRTPMLLNSRCVVIGNVFDNKLEGC